MALRVKISARAAVEIRRAAEWWVVNRPAKPAAISEDYYTADDEDLDILAFWHSVREHQPRL